MSNAVALRDVLEKYAAPGGCGGSDFGLPQDPSTGGISLNSLYHWE